MWLASGIERTYGDLVGAASDEGLQPVETAVFGEFGFADWCIRLIQAGHCACDGCGGHLVNDACLSCGCQHYVQEPNRFHGRHPVCIPVYEPGMCSAADARTEEQLGEHRRVERPPEPEE